MNHEKNFKHYFLYHIVYEKRNEDRPTVEHEYYSAKGRTRAVERFRQSHPYEMYRIKEIAQVLSFKDWE